MFFELLRWLFQSKRQWSPANARTPPPASPLGCRLVLFQWAPSASIAAKPSTGVGHRLLFNYISLGRVDHALQSTTAPPILPARPGTGAGSTGSWRRNESRAFTFSPERLGPSRHDAWEGPELESRAEGLRRSSPTPGTLQEPPPASFAGAMAAAKSFPSGSYAKTSESGRGV